MAPYTSTRRGMLGAIALAPVIIAAPAAGAVGIINPDLTALFARYHSVYNAHERYSKAISEPARIKLAQAKEAAKASIPHVEVTVDMSWSEWSASPTKTLSSADRVQVVGARVTATTVHEPADLWSPEQHRYFAEVRRFYDMCLERDAQVEDAVRAAERTHCCNAEIAQEDVAWDAVDAASVAVIDFKPRSVAELHAKLAFYSDTCIVPDDQMLDTLLADVGWLSGAV